MVSTRVTTRKNGRIKRQSMRRIATATKRETAKQRKTHKKTKIKTAEAIEKLTDLERIELMDAEKRRQLLDNKNGDKRGMMTPLTHLRVNQFGKDGRKPPGRKGSPNRIPSDLVVAIISACEAVGYDKDEDPTHHIPGLIPYLTRCAELHRVEYMRLLEKLLPNMVHFLANVNGNLTVSRYESLDEARDALRARGIPVDGLLLQALPAAPPAEVQEGSDSTEEQ